MQLPGVGGMGSEGICMIAQQSVYLWCAVLRWDAFPSAVRADFDSHCLGANALRETVDATPSDAVI